MDGGVDRALDFKARPARLRKLSGWDRTPRSRPSGRPARAGGPSTAEMPAERTTSCQGSGKGPTTSQTTTPTNSAPKQARTRRRRSRSRRFVRLGPPRLDLGDPCAHDGDRTRAGCFHVVTSAGEIVAHQACLNRPLAQAGNTSRKKTPASTLSDDDVRTRVARPRIDDLLRRVGEAVAVRPAHGRWRARCRRGLSGRWTRSASSISPSRRSWESRHAILQAGTPAGNESSVQQQAGDRRCCVLPLGR